MIYIYFLLSRTTFSAGSEAHPIYLFNAIEVDFSRCYHEIIFFKTASVLRKVRFYGQYFKHKLWLFFSCLSHPLSPLHRHHTRTCTTLLSADFYLAPPAIVGHKGLINKRSGLAFLVVSVNKRRVHIIGDHIILYIYIISCDQFNWLHCPSQFMF